MTSPKCTHFLSSISNSHTLALALFGTLRRPPRENKKITLPFTPKDGKTVILPAQPARWVSWRLLEECANFARCFRSQILLSHRSRPVVSPRWDRDFTCFIANPLKGLQPQRRTLCFISFSRPLNTSYFLNNQLEVRSRLEA